MSINFSQGSEELCMCWVDPCVGSGWVEIFQFLVGWVGSTPAKVLEFWKDYVNAFKPWLDEIWLHQAVKFVSCIGLGPNFPTCNGLCQSAAGLGWIGSHKRDPWTTLGRRPWIDDGNYREDSRRQTSSRHYDIVICTDQIGIGQSTWWESTDSALVHFWLDRLTSSPKGFGYMCL